MIMIHLKPILINGSIVLGLSLSNVEMVLKITVLALTICYTSWKWYSDYKAKKAK